jgi:hypothetical protein
MAINFLVGQDFLSYVSVRQNQFPVHHQGRLHALG